jgi:D-sedoheptulose 7-phosphate isomerase
VSSVANEAAVHLLRERLGDAIAAHERMKEMDPQPFADAVAAIIGALATGGKLLVFGNGGSCADAQHVAAELIGRFQRVRAPFAAIALTTDMSVLTSIANDESFDRVFARQIEALGRPGDVALAITTSGESPNVLAAIAAARTRGVRTIALTGGGGGEAGRTADVHVNVPSAVTARSQEVHRTVLHALCEVVEASLGNRVVGGHA